MSSKNLGLLRYFAFFVCVTSLSTIVYFQTTVKQSFKFHEHIDAENVIRKMTTDNKINPEALIEDYLNRATDTVVTMGPKAPVQHYRNVCIDPSEPIQLTGCPFQGRIQVYDDRFRNSTIDYLRIATNIRTYYENNYWIVDFKNYSKPKRWKTHNSTAYFVPYWRGIANIYSSLELIVPKVNGQLSQSANLMTPEEITLNKTLVISTKGYVKDSVFSLNFI